MSRKRKQLSKEAQARVNLASQLTSEVLQKGGIPEIVIAAKPGSRELSEVTYMIASPLEEEQIRYVLSRVLGLMDGRIQENN